MRNKLVSNKNVIMLNGVMTELWERPTAVPGIAVVVGATGTGKTTALANAICSHNAIFVRADAVTTVASLLDSICFELGIDYRQRNADKLRAIRAALREAPRPIFVDEADYLTRDQRMLDTLRDIFDTTGVPVVLIGMEGITRRLKRYPQFERRISQCVEFRPCDMEDTALMIRDLCEVDVSRDLIERVFVQTKGSVGLIVVAIAHIEAFARGHRWAAITNIQWGDRPLFLGDRPREVA